MARSNGGIIGKSNKASFGKCTVTSKTSTGSITLQPGTKLVDTLIVAGGGGGGTNCAAGGGAGAGGYREFNNIKTIDLRQNNLVILNG